MAGAIGRASRRRRRPRCAARAGRCHAERSGRPVDRVDAGPATRSRKLAGRGGGGCRIRSHRRKACPSYVPPLGRLVERLPEPVTTGRVRLWVDRSFTVRGSGTVVTGTLGSGQLAVGDELEVHGRRVRVRGLQCAGRPADVVPAVARVAVNLRGVPARRGAPRRRPGHIRGLAFHVLYGCTGSASTRSGCPRSCCSTSAPRNYRCGCALWWTDGSAQPSRVAATPGGRSGHPAGSRCAGAGCVRARGRPGSTGADSARSGAAPG